MKYERLGKYVSLSQGLVVNKSTESLFSEVMDIEHPYPLLRIVDFEDGNHASYSKYVSKEVPNKVVTKLEKSTYWLNKESTITELERKMMHVGWEK